MGVSIYFISAISAIFRKPGVRGISSSLDSTATLRSQSLDKAPGRPVVPGEQRAEVLAALTCVDFVVLFDEPDPLRLVETLLPDVLVKGGDWALDRIIGRDVVESHGGAVYSISVIPDVSTTEIIQRILKFQSNSPGRR